MVDAFESLLSEALSPPKRDSDHRFVARVQAHIAIEDRLRAARSAELRELGLQALALFAVAAGLLMLLRSAEVSRIAGQVPGVALLGLLCAFALLVALLSARGDGGSAAKLNG